VFDRTAPTFRSNLLPPSSEWKALILILSALGKSYLIETYTAFSASYDAFLPLNMSPKITLRFNMG
jgi:hypothetical protein